MANKIYPKWKEALLQASSDSALTGTVKVALTKTKVKPILKKNKIGVKYEVKF